MILQEIGFKQIPNSLAQRIPLGKRVYFLLRLLRNFLSNFILSISNIDLIEHHYLEPKYQSYLRECTQDLAPLGEDVDKVILSSLEKEGIYVTSLKELGFTENEAFLETCGLIMKELKQKSSNLKKVGKDFANIMSTYQHLCNYPEFFKWGLQERLISIAENYIQTPVGYDAFHCMLTKPFAPEKNRLWHFDFEDRRMLKAILYLKDVNEQSGPFEYLNRQDSEFIYSQLSRSDRYCHFSQDRLNSLMKDRPDFKVNSCTGAAGTVIFIDTAKLLHRGKPTQEKSREAAFFGYVSRKPRNPFRCANGKLSLRQLKELSEGLPEKSIDCLLWKTRLPWLVKLIPRYHYLPRPLGR